METKNTDELAVQPFIENMGDEKVDYIDFLQGRPLQLADLKTLIVDPVQFYKSQIFLADQKWINLLMFGYAASSSLQNISTELPILFAWLMAFFGAVMGAIGAWLLGGWWFNIRLSWCVLFPVNNLTGRIIYAYNKLLYTIPVLFFSLGIALTKSVGDKDVSIIFWLSILLLIIALPLDLWTSYNNVRTLNGLYEVKKIALFSWFLGLPLIVNCILLINIIRFVLLATGKIMP